MVIGRLISPVHSLGPGNRTCLWTQGCSKRCVGCMSTDLQPARGTVMENQQLAQVIIKVGQKGACTGLTISGGDPFEQPDNLLELLRLVRDAFEDILVYTGYTLQEIYDESAGKTGIECLKYIDVLIDGRYQKELNTKNCVLRGSGNQIIHFLNAEMKPRYDRYMEAGRMIESFIYEGNTIITGILNEEE